MKNLGKSVVCFVLVLLAVAAWYFHSKQSVREGTVPLRGLKQSVSVRYDERGIPHIQAQNRADMYRALGYVQAQDRLLQMNMGQNPHTSP